MTIQESPGGSRGDDSEAHRGDGEPHSDPSHHHEGNSPRPFQTLPATDASGSEAKPAVCTICRRDHQAAYHAQHWDQLDRQTSLPHEYFDPAPADPELPSAPLGPRAGVTLWLLYGLLAAAFSTAVWVWESNTTLATVSGTAAVTLIVWMAKRVVNHALTGRYGEPPVA